MSDDEKDLVFAGPMNSGLTKREFFAAMAMQGLLAGADVGVMIEVDHLATQSMAASDALMEALSKPNNKARRLAEIESHLKNLGGWREAISELEDFCGEPVRLKNMTAALNQIDELSALLKQP